MQKVDLSLCHLITDSALSLFLDYPALHTLNLSGCIGLTDKIVEHLESLLNLKHLTLYRCQQLTDEGISKLFYCKFQLEYLSLSHLYNLTDCAFQNIAAQGQLVELNVRYTKITDDGIKYFLGLKNLKILILYFCENITKDTLKKLQTLPKLEEVNCRYTKVKAGAGCQFMLNNRITVIAGDK
uniref:F-box/LRR-repeat protein 15-like leucin rich repeat domain-containing protein n=1 Tax=Arcella intermedia TaxID=1963864 RepID=A0A6B2LLD2_9EUKA